MSGTLDVSASCSIYVATVALQLRVDGKSVDSVLLGVALAKGDGEDDVRRKIGRHCIDDGRNLDGEALLWRVSHLVSISALDDPRVENAKLLGVEGEGVLVVDFERFEGDLANALVATLGCYRLIE